MQAVIAVLLIFSAIALPLRYAYSLALATSFAIFYFIISDVATAMFVILFLRILASAGWSNVFTVRLFKAHILLVLFGGMSAIWATQPSSSISIFIAQIKVLIIAYVSLQVIKSKEDFKFVIYGVALGATYILVCLTGWRLGFFGVSPGMYYGNISTYGRLLIQYLFPGRHTPINSNTWAALVSLSIGLIATFLRYNNKINLKWPRIIAGTLIIISAIATSDLASRAGLLSFMVTVVLVLVFLTPKRFYRLAGISLILFFTGSVTMSLVVDLLPSSFESIQSRLSSEEEDPRVEIWSTGLNMALDNIVIGVGLGNSSIEFKNYMTAQFSTNRLALHNSFLTHLAELGFLGFLLFLYLAYLWQRPTIQSKEAKVIFIIVSVNILINAISHSFEYENHFIAIIYASHKYFLIENQEISARKLEARRREIKAELGYD